MFAIGINNVIFAADMKRGNTLYNEAMTAIDGLQIGDITIIDVPGNLVSFRKYISEIGKRYGQRFTSKVIEDKLHIMRVKYHSIHEKIA